VRSRILATTTELVSVKPIDEIKIDDVATHAKVSKGTFYKCFRSVEDLLNLGAKKAGQELVQPINAVGSAIPDAAMRVATKTRVAIQMLTGVPLLGKFMLKIEWPFGDAKHKGYRDIEKDIVEGIKQGCFTDMPTEIAVNLVIGTLRMSVHEMLISPKDQEYEDQIICHLLLSLGVEAKACEAISKMPMDQVPNLPKKGLIGKISTLVR
jgi:AcrR family transcriptional regulator